MNPIQKAQKCPKCFGRGSDGRGNKCRKCKGTGEIIIYSNGSKLKGKAHHA